MPELSRFFGIVIGMFYREHGVPHFHAVYGERRISVEVDTLTVHGDFPQRAQFLVLEWAGRHRNLHASCIFLRQAECDAIHLHECVFRLANRLTIRLVGVREVLLSGEG